MTSKQRTVLGFFREKGKTKPVTRSTAELRRKKKIKNPRKLRKVAPGSRWTLSYKRNRQLKDLTEHFLEKAKPRCYFCHKLLLPKDLPDNITEHHINGDHTDNRPKNKALAHETCHRKHHYKDVAPQNGIRKLGSGPHNPKAELYEYRGKRFVLVPYKVGKQKGLFLLRIYRPSGKYPTAHRIGRVGKMWFTRSEAFTEAKKFIDQFSH